MLTLMLKILDLESDDQASVDIDHVRVGNHARGVWTPFQIPMVVVARNH
jgi:hypothetical protein